MTFWTTSPRKNWKISCNEHRLSNFHSLIIKNMRKLFLTALILGVFYATSTAQGGARIRERLRAERVAVYTDVLKLTSDEAQGFWPIYNAFIEDREKIQEDLKSMPRENLSDADAEAMVKKHFDLKQRELDLEKDMVQKMRKVISMQKIVKIPEAERIFRQNVLEKVKDRVEQRRGGRQ